MTDDILRYEMAVFEADNSVQFGLFEQAKAGGPTSFASVLSSIGHMLDTHDVRVTEFANPENPLHWHVLFWDALGLTKGLPRNQQIIDRMREVSEDFPEVYGRAVLVRDKFWTDDEPAHGGTH